MSFSTLTLFHAAGGLTRAVTVGGLGYLFGNNLPCLESLLRKPGTGMFIAACIIVFGIWLGRQMAIHEIEARAWMIRMKQVLGLQHYQSWLVSRFQSDQVMALNLGRGLLLVIFSGWIFGALAEDVLSRGSMTLFDSGAGRWILGLATEDSSRFFYFVTFLGSAWFLSAAGLLLGGWLARRRQWLQLSMLVLNVGGGALLNVLLKNAFLRPRPDFPNAYYHVSGYSFPSGHAMSSILFYGMASYLIASQGVSRKTRVGLEVAAFTVSLLVGFSRIFLGVHYLTDVVGGWAAGTFWLVVCVTALELIQLSRTKNFNHS